MSKHSARPTSEAIPPPRAAPKMRATFTVTELSVTAFRTSGRDTSSGISDWRAGLSKTLTNPSATASR